MSRPPYRWLTGLSPVLWMLPLLGCGGTPQQAGMAVPAAMGLVQTFQSGGNASSLPASPPPAGSPLQPSQVLGAPANPANPADGLGVTGDPGQPTNTQKGTLLKRGRASWYASGTQTATGERFDPDGISAAMYGTRSPFQVRVVRTDTGQELVVRVNDAGPFAVDSQGKALRPLRPHPTRVIDLSRGAFSRLGNLSEGTFPVEVYKL